MTEGDINKGEEVREVYASFGLAIYSSQCLEHGLVNAFVYLQLIPSIKESMGTEVWQITIDSFAEKHFKKMGMLIKHLETVTDLSEDLVDMLSKALETRNWLAHSYFREHAREFLISEERKKMISELQDIAYMFKSVDEHLDEILRPVLEKYGITEEKIATASKEMLDGTIS